jgi:hypothetical protein
MLIFPHFHVTVINLQLMYLFSFIFTFFAFLLPLSFLFFHSSYFSHRLNLHSSCYTLILVLPPLFRFLQMRSIEKMMAEEILQSTSTNQREQHSSLPSLPWDRKETAQMPSSSSGSLRAAAERLSSASASTLMTVPSSAASAHFVVPQKPLSSAAVKQPRTNSTSEQVWQLSPSSTLKPPVMSCRDPGYLVTEKTFMVEMEEGQDWEANGPAASGPSIGHAIPGRSSGSATLGLSSGPATSRLSSGPTNPGLSVSRGPPRLSAGHVPSGVPKDPATPGLSSNPPTFGQSIRPATPGRPRSLAIPRQSSGSAHPELSNVPGNTPGISNVLPKKRKLFSDSTDPQIF